jgi:hypothetical protein
VGAGVGVRVGDVVGSAEVGALVFHSHVWFAAVHSPSEQRWDGAQSHRWPAPSSSCSHIPYSVESQSWVPSLQACRVGIAVGAGVGAGVGPRVGAGVGYRVGAKVVGSEVVGAKVGARVGDGVGISFGP